MTQDERVLEHLKNYESITTWQAIDLFGYTRLSAIIHRLRKQYNIESEVCCGKNRYGDKIHWVKYILKV